MALLGNDCDSSKRPRLIWDSNNMKFTNNEMANELVHKEYRKGWSL